jgi:hypothetical protein
VTFSSDTNLEKLWWSWRTRIILLDDTLYRYDDMKSFACGACHGSSKFHLIGGVKITPVCFWECLLESLLLLLGSLLGQQHGVDVGQDTAGGNGDAAQQLAQLLIVAHGQLDVAGDDAGLLVVAGSIACQLQDLSCQVLQHCGQVHGSTSTHAAGVLQDQGTKDVSHCYR